MKQLLAQALKHQAKRYLKKNDFKIVAITGAVGKTSTTQAIATILSEKYKVRKTIGNYNSEFGVPLSVLGRTMPGSLKNPLSWIVLFAKNELSILSKTEVEVLVLELGTDKPGDIAKFKWLNPDISVVTSVAPEHMEFFKDLDEVAEEELSVTKYSKTSLVNQESIDKKYISNNFETYSLDNSAYLIDPSELDLIGDHSLICVAGAILVGQKLGLNDKQLINGAKKIKPISGRMNPLEGINNSTLIDDSYNSSPKANIVALDYVYKTKAKQKIALLGNMNELGKESKKHHQEVGKYCQPTKLDFVVTLGEHANKYLAQEAENNGCHVYRASSAIDAGNYIKDKLKPGALVLLKGSQNGVFAEEAVKILLKNASDKDKLVRQSNFWLSKKREMGLIN